MDIIEKNAAVLRREFEWLEQCILTRRREYAEEMVIESESIAAPPLLFPEIPYTQFVLEQNLIAEERLMLILSIAAAINPHLLDALAFYKSDGAPCMAAGVKRSQQSGHLVPSGFTALFLCGGKNEERRIKCSLFFDATHIFQQKKIITLAGALSSEPKYSGSLTIHPDWLDLFTIGSHTKPVYGEDFPAEEVFCSMTWDDMVMNDLTSTRLRYMINNITHGKLLQNTDLKRVALFHGPAGTGKTTSAAIIGKICNKPVFKIDTSQVVSKYIGETEKNLARIFDRAQDKGWILFFDEADSLFSKRIENPQSSNDKFVNNEINYVLQRLNSFKETVILGTNLPDTLDKAMGRRQYMKVPFYYPDASQKLRLWEMKKPKDIMYHDAVDFEALSAHPNLSPDNIQNVVNFAYIETMVPGLKDISMDLLVEGLKIESEKENKMLFDPLKIKTLFPQISLSQLSKPDLPMPSEKVITEESIQPSEKIYQKTEQGTSNVFDYTILTEEEKNELSKISPIVKNWMKNGITMYRFENGEIDYDRTVKEILQKNNTPQEQNTFEKQLQEHRVERENLYKDHLEKESEIFIQNQKYKQERQEKLQQHISLLQPLKTTK